MNLDGRGPKPLAFVSIPFGRGQRQLQLLTLDPTQSLHMWGNVPCTSKSLQRNTAVMLALFAEARVYLKAVVCSGRCARKPPEFSQLSMFITPFFCVFTICTNKL